MIDPDSQDADSNQDRREPRDSQPGTGHRLLQTVAALGDGAVLLAFAAIGRASHHRGDGGSIGAVFGTAAPFLIGWYLAAFPLGAYRRPAFAGLQTGTVATARSWLAGGILGLALRSLLERHVVPVTFAAITLGFNLTLLLAWRASLVTLARRASRS